MSAHAAVSACSFCSLSLLALLARSLGSLSWLALLARSLCSLSLRALEPVRRESDGHRMSVFCGPQEITLMTQLHGMRCASVSAGQAELSDPRRCGNRDRGIVPPVHWRLRAGDALLCG